jgi:GT2 family glycosyltransferase
LLQDCLDSIYKHTKGIDFEVWVVDNASSDGSPDLVNKLTKSRNNLNLLNNPKNLGFAAANNQVLKIAKGKYCLLLNSDTLLKENAFKKLLDFARKHPQAGVVGPKLLNQDGSDQPSTAPFFSLPNVFLWLFTGDRFLYSSPFQTKSVDWVMGSALLVKKEAANQVGLLDEKFFMYVEEQEWCYRIQKASWQVWFYPKAKIFHLVRGSSAEGRQKVIWWIFQGLVYFYRKHFATWQLVVLKFLLRSKASGAYLIGWLTGDQYLKKTYAKAFKLVGQKLS